jgi:plastocyanin
MQRLHPERRPRRHRVVLLVAAFLAAIPFLAGAARAGDATVVIDNFAFSPSTLTVKTGTTVTWRNSDDIPHTVASVKRAFKSKALETSDSFSFTFNEAGGYAYFCSLHPHMTGQIVVEQANAAAK